MKLFIAVAVVALTTGAHAQVAASDPRADEVIRQKCESEWPNDFNMRLYCINKQREAARVLRDGEPPQGPIYIERPYASEEVPPKKAQFYDGFGRPLDKKGEPIR